MRNKLLFFNNQEVKKRLPYTMVHAYILRDFNNRNYKEKLELIQNTPLEIVATLADHSFEFAIHCNCEELDEHWSRLWCAHGIILTRQKNLPEMLFHSHPKLNQFDLARGVHFFHLSQEMRKNRKFNFSHSEIKFLQIAIEYGSIHAMQRYNEYLYSQLTKAANAQEAEALYAELIDNSTNLQEQSGSYGFMVLAEAFGRYCMWLMDNSEYERAEQAYRSVLQSLDCAQAILGESTYSIKNASLGIGLKCSNSMGIDSPNKAKEYFMGLYQERCASAARPRLYAPPC
ncbi:DUF5630 domain-containing protein [Legionella micdadei]|uniref:Uncharacterized protein n=1 Tax=Legionella micdadei TaxID=451 RepID=A0A098GFR8_LEGMI|nr:DUF5630 domain-containing protein [Legionella micdadei]KTD29170.1 hypothetical protein Lmic_1090 [Legionella micdadei]NSL17455.1 DUF5630 domain-containing protein [Legionella micdadei]CEG61324.1 conserved protein of unknown function [Legionella micdadei]SCY37700.1 hypothetical protein SAMN02982997_01533 [Legionella micdadei]